MDSIRSETFFKKLVLRALNLYFFKSSALAPDVWGEAFGRAVILELALENRKPVGAVVAAEDGVAWADAPFVSVLPNPKFGFLSVEKFLLKLKEGASVDMAGFLKPWNGLAGGAGAETFWLRNKGWIILNG